MDLSVFVVPVKCNTKVLLRFPISFYLIIIILSECVQKVQCMFFSDIFYSEIINYQCKTDGTSLVSPESRSLFALEVALLIQSLLEQLLGYDACLRESVHALTNFNVDPAVFCCFLS